MDRAALRSEITERYANTFRALAEVEADDSCLKCGADLDDGECEECERAAPLDFDT